MPAVSTNSTDGYWGPPTSSIDWCESNYTFTPYIAEFHNTLSSLAIVFAGLAGILLHKCPFPFAVAFGCIICVGLGSSAFHLSLKKESQWTDEVPMLYSALSFAFITVCQRYNISQPMRKIIGFVLVLYAVGTTLLVTLTEGEWQFKMFHLSFGLVEIYTLVQIGIITYSFQKSSITSEPISNSSISKLSSKPISRPISNTSISNLKSNTSIFHLGITGFASYILGVLVWFIDLFHCNTLTQFNPQFHAWWHVFVR